ncbi:MAG: protein translocase subunit SecF [Alphaproteobacteria bacterium]|nr:protein translocase subunit SecF [Alphaproteobacteria bacterium]
MFKLIKLFPAEIHFNAMKYSKVFIGIACIFLTFAIFTISTKSLNYGIDFSGGILMEIKTNGPANIEKIRKDLKTFSPEIQSQGDAGDIVSIRLPQGNKDEAQISEMLNNVKSILGDNVEYRNTQIVGPKVGADLIKSGTLAVVLSILIIAIYIWARFELPFAIGAGISLLHDVILAIGMLAFTGLEFNLTTLASLLTLAGYSINDTVVIYDRIRTNLKLYRNKSLKDVINLSIDTTFSRTVLTSVTTMFAVLAIFIFGGEVLRGFSAVMLFGIIVGTYSSMLLSTSTLLFFPEKKIRK